MRGRRVEEAEIRDIRFVCWYCLDWLQCANVEDANGIVCTTCGDMVPMAVVLSDMKRASIL